MSGNAPSTRQTRSGIIRKRKPVQIQPISEASLNFDHIQINTVDGVDLDMHFSSESESDGDESSDDKKEDDEDERGPPNAKASPKEPVAVPRPNPTAARRPRERAMLSMEEAFAQDDVRSGEADFFRDLSRASNPPRRLVHNPASSVAVPARMTHGWSDEPPPQLVKLIADLRHGGFDASQLLSHNDSALALPPEEIQRQMMMNIHNRRLKMPCFGARHESLLLQEAGFWGGVLYPPCRKGDDCVIKKHGLAIDGMPNPPNVTLCAMMTPEELSDLVAHGAQPADRRMCIMCYRTITAELIMSWRPITRSSTSEADGGSTFPSTVRGVLTQTPWVMQVYYNPMNGVDGYREHCCLVPRNREPIVLPVVMPLLDVLKFCRARDGRGYIDQRRLIYYPLPPPVFQPPATTSASETRHSRADANRQHNEDMQDFRKWSVLATRQVSPLQYEMKWGDASTLRCTDVFFTPSLLSTAVHHAMCTLSLSVAVPLAQENSNGGSAFGAIDAKRAVAEEKALERKNAGKVPAKTTRTVPTIAAIAKSINAAHRNYTLRLFLHACVTPKVPIRKLSAFTTPSAAPKRKNAVDISFTEEDRVDMRLLYRLSQFDVYNKLRSASPLPKRYADHPVPGRARIQRYSTTTDVDAENDKLDAAISQKPHVFAVTVREYFLYFLERNESWFDVSYAIDLPVYRNVVTRQLELIRGKSVDEVDADQIAQLDKLLRMTLIPTRRSAVSQIRLMFWRGSRPAVPGWVRSALSLIVEAVGCNEPDIFDDVMSYAPLFLPHVRRIEALTTNLRTKLVEYDEGGITNDEIVEYFARTQRASPELIALMRWATGVIFHARRGHFAEPLPRNLTLNQERRRYPVVHWCPNCKKVHEPIDVVSSSNRTRNERDNRNVFSGSRYITCEYTTGRMFCNNSRCAGKSLEIVRIPVVGQVWHGAEGALTVCMQDGCGRLTRITSNTAWNSRGCMCKSCYAFAVEYVYHWTKQCVYMASSASRPRKPPAKRRKTNSSRAQAVRGSNEDDEEDDDGGADEGGWIGCEADHVSRAPIAAHVFYQPGELGPQNPAAEFMMGQRNDEYMRISKVRENNPDSWTLEADLHFSTLSFCLLHDDFVSMTSAAASVIQQQKKERVRVYRALYGKERRKTGRAKEIGAEYVRETPSSVSKFSRNGAIRGSGLRGCDTGDI
jgi:hypothetical protein